MPRRASTESLFRPPAGNQKPFANIRIFATASSDGEAFRRLWTRDAEGHGRTSTIIPVDDPDGADPNADGWHRYAWRVWWEPPDRWRDEMLFSGASTYVAIVRPDVKLIYAAGERTL